MIIEKDIKDNNNILFVSFAGLGKRYPVPEFKSMLEPLNVNKVFIIDNTRGWYLTIRNSVIKKIDRIIYETKPKKIIFFGASMGGYGALMFGIHFEVDQILAFNPQTSMDEDELEKCNDRRFLASLVKIKESKTYDSNISKSLWDYDKECKTIIDIYYSDHPPYHIQPELFKKNIKYLNLNLHSVPFNKKDPNVAKQMRDSGELMKLFNSKIKEFEYE